jgi:hypothetical protein
MVLTDPMLMLNPRQVYKQIAERAKAEKSGNVSSDDGGARTVKVSLRIRHDACGPVWGHSADNTWNAIKGALPRSSTSSFLPCSSTSSSLPTRSYYVHWPLPIL